MDAMSERESRKSASELGIPSLARALETLRQVLETHPTDDLLKILTPEQQSQMLQLHTLSKKLSLAHSSACYLQDLMGFAGSKATIQEIHVRDPADRRLMSGYQSNTKAKRLLVNVSLLKTCILRANHEYLLAKGRLHVDCILFEDEFVQRLGTMTKDKDKDYIFYGKTVDIGFELLRDYDKRCHIFQLQAFKKDTDVGKFLEGLAAFVVEEKRRIQLTSKRPAAGPPDRAEVKMIENAPAVIWVIDGATTGAAEGATGAASSWGGSSRWKRRRA
jgi:hypothetical protein